MITFEYPEGATPLDPNEIDGLKLRHITTRGELDRWEQENIQKALSWLESRRRSDILNEGFICQLHEKMFGKVWKWAGQFRRSEKNIGVTWTKIPVELRTLLSDVKYWVENKIYSADEIAYRFHHKLVLIHLFPNGNGRHSRMMADILLSEILKEESFTWGQNSPYDAKQLRRHYIEALKQADTNNYTLLGKFVRT